MNFVEKMTELEKILKDLEGDSLSLDLALTEYERGIALVRECRAYLAEAQQKISMLSQEGEELPLAAATAEGAKSDE